MRNKQFDISIDHPMLSAAKNAFDICMKQAIDKAIATGSDEGSAQLKISFSIFTAMDNGELKRTPMIEFKAGYSVPMKESVNAKIVETSTLQLIGNEWAMVNNQISMDELIAEGAE